MSQTNKDVAKAFLTALGKGDVEGLQRVLHPEITAIARGTSALSGVRNFQDILGAAGLLGQVTRDGITFTVVSITAEDDRVSIETDGEATLQNGAPYNNQYNFVMTIREGKIILLKEYFCTKLVDTVLMPVAMQIMQGASTAELGSAA